MNIYVNLLFSYFPIATNMNKYQKFMIRQEIDICLMFAYCNAMKTF